MGDQDISYINRRLDEVAGNVQKIMHALLGSVDGKPGLLSEHCSRGAQFDEARETIKNLEERIDVLEKDKIKIYAGTSAICTVVCVAYTVIHNYLSIK